MYMYVIDDVTRIVYIDDKAMILKKTKYTLSCKYEWCIIMLLMFLSYFCNVFCF